ncbi:MAG: hypothetical protein ASARMPREDX12_000758 [Alectoria sarmentosa]|nr:MAG: hypothetical protein ASARMPREDX12_000758 [Alectoria sarmentosa]
MTKRKSPEEKPFRKPTSRKRVAFSAPKDAATKARIKGNALTSPLLRLPLEIRNKIWSEVLGDRLVHLRYLYDDDHDFETNEELHVSLPWSNELQAGYGSAWRHLVCEEDCPENKEEEKLTTSDGEVFSTRSHRLCESNLEYDPIGPDMIYGDRYCEFHEMMRLSVLRSCRQIYVEANQILWTTNTFSFADGTALRRFMMTLTINQRRLIKSLRLQMEWDMYMDKEWNNALNMALVRSLSGLRRLRLRIDQHMDARIYECAKSNKNIYTSIFCKGLQKISTLPLTEAEVIVKNPQYWPEDGVWTKADREEFAEVLRKLLLNPKGAEIYAKDQLKRKEERRKEREYAAKIKASMSRPRLQAEAERMIDSPVAGPSE